MADISKETLKKIKEERIIPRPRWYFLSKNYFFWLMFLLTTILGSIASSMVLLLTGDVDWDIFPYLDIGLPKAILMSLPYLWIILLFFFLYIIYYNFSRTRTGYRYRFILIFLMSLLISALLGWGFCYYGWSEIMDRQLRTRIPGYHHLVYGRQKQWMQPERGLLSGTIMIVEPDKNLIQLKDLYSKNWAIDISQARIRGNVPLSRDLEIKILGKQMSEQAFKADEIRVSRGFQQGKRMGLKFNRLNPE